MSKEVKYDQLTLTELYQRAGIRPSGVRSDGGFNYGNTGTRLCEFLESNGVLFCRTKQSEKNPKGIRQSVLWDPNVENLVRQYIDDINNQEEDVVDDKKKKISIEEGISLHLEKEDVIISLLTDLLSVWKNNQ